MGLFGSYNSELLDIIQWVDTTNDTIIWKFPRQDNAIKMGARLTVRESQVAIFMNEGKIADIYGPGMHTLTTQNMPILTTLKSWKFGFISPFMVDVYFVSTRQFTNQKWGTSTPVMIRDAEFGPVRIRAYGSFNFSVKDPAVFLQQISATNPNFSTEDIEDQLRNIAVTRGMSAVASSKIAVLDLAGNYDTLSTLVTERIQPDFNEIGLNLNKFLVENISFPPEVEKMLDKRSEMGIIGNLGAYAQFQASNAIEKSAENSMGGNLGSAAMGLGVGAAMMKQVGNIFQANQVTPNAVSAGPDIPPPIPVAVEYFLAVNGKPDGPHSLQQLSAMVLSQGLVASSMVWKKGMANWAAASTVTELAEIFNSVPPPLPM